MQDLAVTNENLSVVIFVATYFSFIGPRKPKLSMNNRVTINSYTESVNSKNFQTFSTPPVNQYFQNYFSVYVAKNK